MISTDILGDIGQKSRPKPNNTEMLMYLFFERGISYEEFKRLPLPYILSMASVHGYIRDLEAKEMEKAKRKRR